MSKKNNNTSLAHPIYWPAWFGIGILWLIAQLPHRAQIHVGKALGKFLSWFPTKLKHTTLVNINLCFPEKTAKERKKLMKENFASLGVGLIEAAMAWWLPDHKLDCLFNVTGLEYVEQAFARGKGIILLGPHCTCLEMVGRLLGMKYSFAVMYRPHKKRMVAFIQERFRKKHYINYIPRHRIRALLRALNNNMAIWYAYDVDGGPKRSVFAPFFGIETASLTSVTRFVKLSDAAVVPINFYRREDNFKYEVVLLPPLENFPSGNLTVDATRLNTILEDAIRQHPEQYVWQYKRFKTRPPGEKRFY